MSKVITVSIVDDQQDIRENIAGYVGGTKGFSCLSSYASAEEALPKLAKDKPDVILMDINLGGMSGIECVRQLKPKIPTTQIVMLTVFEDTEKIFSALAAGASGYLLKRMPPSKLLDAIREVNEGGSPMSAPIARKVVESLQATRPPKPDDTAELSPREREVLEGLAEGCAYKQIADKLGVSIHTVRNYIRRIYEKLHVRSSSQAVARYYRH
ncbi:response regulator [Pedosphaera parvula]|uniref:Two component transcriptional regulator, LuxR family n=1 Tax=Pedosphaera parvula (strain Ellin514) TaxID=320771 RepID=B9XB02_PEDPL|nr:response regulator transcription factor [Pedosphaera parvula]EEF63187.1 two component transcriptional regulator, LuxR family [Pedosphaera parvula Ellin514]